MGMARFLVSYALIEQGLRFNEVGATLLSITPHDIHSCYCVVESKDIPDQPDEPIHSMQVQEIDPPIFYRKGEKITVDWGIKKEDGDVS